jgi:hypothetical protein
MLNYLLALLLTWAVELPVAFLAGYKSKIFLSSSEGRRVTSTSSKFLLSLFLINLITNPLANWFFNLSNHLTIDLYISILLIEAAVVLAEWKLLEYVLKRRDYMLLALSFMINAVSFFAGLLIFWL